ncbi:hypothetical protein BGP_0411 [Beggiatoa sp. PS]|nr:hypothetical protein BGP_0411 [Beggiatoa sp. PS]
MYMFNSIVPNVSLGMQSGTLCVIPLLFQGGHVCIPTLEHWNEGNNGTMRLLYFSAWANSCWQYSESTAYGDRKMNIPLLGGSNRRMPFINHKLGSE